MFKHTLTRCRQACVLSYYMNPQVNGQSYTVAVTSIDNQGNRSTPASLSFVAGGATTTTPQATGGVATPTGLKASVYSATSAEISWTRPTTFGLSYGVSRNGTVMATTTGISYEVSRNDSIVTTTTGISYYDKSLTPATSYTYKVVAIDRNTDRSSPASVMLNTPSGSGGTSGTGGGDSIISNVSPSIVEPANIYTRDGYGLADVMADIDKNDDLTVDIPIHVSAADFPDDGSVSNAELRMRGSGSRNGAQKSLRIKLDSKDNLWRGERYFQFNKHPFDGSRLRNKLATDVMSVIPSLPGIHDEILKTVDYLRENIVTDQYMTEKVDTYFALVAPFQERLPDSAHNPYFNLGSAPSFANAPGKNAESLRSTFRAPIGPILQAPQKQASNWLFSWRPAYDVTGTTGGITYRLQVASTPTFDSGTIVADVGGIPDGTGTLTKSVDFARLPKGNYYARLVATPANEPQRFFQVSGNKLYFNNQSYYGAIRFSVD